MTASDPADRAELTDDGLDSLLRYVDDELLHHIQDTVDPAITLTAVMDIGTVNAEQAHPGEPAHADQPAILIMRRRVLIPVTRSIQAARELARSLGRALDLAARALDGARDVTLDAARVLASDFAPLLDLVHALDLDLEDDLARALALARDLDIALARDLDFARARDLARDLILVLDLTSDRAWDLAEREIIASGADLSLLAIDDVEMVVGVIWDEATSWPSGIANQVRAASQEIRPGVYRVKGGSKRDLAEYARY